MQDLKDVAEQARAYCSHQGAKGIDSLAALMERTKADWERCLEGMTEEQASFAPGEEWSARKVLTHFLKVTDGVNSGIKNLTAGQAPASTDEVDLARAGKTPDCETTEKMREGMAEVFDEIVRLTRALEGNAYLDRQFPHPAFGQMNILEWIAFQRLHGMDHMGQVEKNKADAGYPKA
ncbi:MAG: DinB family protein [Chloroflexi bacterium]|nr:DinB family protein [Chloroflexota bacterium]